MPNIEDKYKYPRTFHVCFPEGPVSPGLQNDDRMHTKPEFFYGKDVVVTEKMDGESWTCYKDGDYHARSLTSPYHPSREWGGRIAAEVGYKLPEGWRISAENIYALHTIKYKNLKSYIQVFAIWDENNRALSWSETEKWAKLLGLETVPVLYKGPFDIDVLREIADKCENNDYSEDPIEGFVLRTEEGFDYPEDPKGNSGSWMINFAKYVKKDFKEAVDNSDEHWMTKEVVPNELKE